MYIETVPNRHSRPTILLREAWREGQHVRKRTLANLTHWPAPKLDALRLLLQDVPLVPLHSLFVVEHSLPHGAVEAIVGTMRHLGLAGLLASTPCRERQLVLWQADPRASALAGVCGRQIQKEAAGGGQSHTDRATERNRAILLARLPVPLPGQARPGTDPDSRQAPPRSGNRRSTACPQ